MALKIYKCLRCGYEWASRKEKMPETCAKCRSPYWNKPRKEKREANLGIDYNLIQKSSLPRINYDSD